MVFAIGFCGLASMFPNRAVVFLFFALCSSESVRNGLFHLGATAFTGVYCPCLITALVLYPRCFFTSAKLLIERALTNTLGVVAFLIVVVIHTVDVATSVFGVKLQSQRHTT